MYIIKNALKNISRSPGRNILIGIITFVIVVSSCVALSIKESAKQAEAEALNQLSITASIGIDREKIAAESNGDRDTMLNLTHSVSSLSLTEMEKYAGSEYVDEFNYSLETSMSGSDVIEAYTTTDEVVGANDGEIRQPFRENIGGYSGIGKQGDFTLIGYNDEGGMSSFISGDNKISGGSIFNFIEDSTCIISDTLANYNNLSIGDVISLTNPNIDGEEYDMKITGIYTTNDSSNTDMKFSTAQDPANQIYTSYATLSSFINESIDNAAVSTDDSGVEFTTALRSTVSGVYSFDDILNYENFKDSLTSLGLGEYYTLNSSDVSNYQNSLTPIENLGNYANIFLILVLSVGGVILVVLNLFNIRERKYEVGVLTAIGMKKGKVAIQFMTELFMITFISVILGTVAGALLSVPTANHLLDSQISSMESTQQQQEQNFGRPGGGLGMNARLAEEVNYLDSIDASTDLRVTGQLMGIGLLLTVVSSLGAVVFIVRFEPLKILSNRN